MVNLPSPFSSSNRSDQSPPQVNRVVQQPPPVNWVVRSTPPQLHSSPSHVSPLPNVPPSATPFPIQVMVPQVVTRKGPGLKRPSAYQDPRQPSASAESIAAGPLTVATTAQRATGKPVLESMQIRDNEAGNIVRVMSSKMLSNPDVVVRAIRKASIRDPQDIAELTRMLVLATLYFAPGRSASGGVGHQCDILFAGVTRIKNALHAMIYKNFADATVLEPSFYSEYFGPHVPAEFIQFILEHHSDPGMKPARKRLPGPYGDHCLQAQKKLSDPEIQGARLCYEGLLATFVEESPERLAHMPVAATTSVTTTTTIVPATRKRPLESRPQQTTQTFARADMAAALEERNVRRRIAPETPVSIPISPQQNHLPPHTTFQTWSANVQTDTEPIVAPSATSTQTWPTVARTESLDEQPPEAVDWATDWPEPELEYAAWLAEWQF